LTHLMSEMGHKRSLVSQTDWKFLDLPACSITSGTRLPLLAENEANDAFDLLEPSRIEREGYFNRRVGANSTKWSRKCPA
jgi:hypothetical protein